MRTICSISINIIYKNVYLIDEIEITNRVANLYSKIEYNKLLNESSSNLYNICKDLSVNLTFYSKNTKNEIIFKQNISDGFTTIFKIYYTDYLKLASNLRDDFRKLTNQQLSKGIVYIQKKNLIRLLQEKARKRILESQSHDSDNIESDKRELFKIQEFKSVYESILEFWNKNKPTYKEQEFNDDYLDLKNSTYFPPCTNVILQRAKKGHNLIHEERLHLTWFLIAVKYDFEDIINIFSSVADFDRKRTEYQVNFAVKKGYSPYACSKLKSLGLCYASQYKDKLCNEGFYSKKEKRNKQIKHPLTYVKIVKYRIERKNIHSK